MKVGDYVRTKYGIAKYISDKFTKNAMYYVVDKDIMICNVEGWENCLSGSNEIIKSSPNIIDLIEVGDYVNGHKVVDIAKAPKRAVYIEDVKQKSGLIPYTRDNIKSILTKEQFESMEYKVC